MIDERARACTPSGVARHRAATLRARARRGGRAHGPAHVDSAITPRCTTTRTTSRASSSSPTCATCLSSGAPTERAGCPIPTWPSTSSWCPSSACSPWRRRAGCSCVFHAGAVPARGPSPRARHPRPPRARGAALRVRLLQHALILRIRQLHLRRRALPPRVRRLARRPPRAFMAPARARLGPDHGFVPRPQDVVRLPRPRRGHGARARPASPVAARRRPRLLRDDPRRRAGVARRRPAPDGRWVERLGRAARQGEGARDAGVDLRSGHRRAHRGGARGRRPRDRPRRRAPFDAPPDRRGGARGDVPCFPQRGREHLGRGQALPDPAAAVSRC